MSRGITNAQKALVHVAARQLEWDEETYRKALRQHGGVRSAKDLTPDGFKRYMELCESYGFKSKRRDDFGDRTGYATASQLAYLRDLWAKYTDGNGTEASLHKWLERTFKTSHTRFLTRDDCRKAIGTLRKMCARREAS